MSRFNFTISSKIWALSGTLLTLMCLCLLLLVYQINRTSALLSEQSASIDIQNERVGQQFQRVAQQHGSITNQAERAHHSAAAVEQLRAMTERQTKLTQTQYDALGVQSLAQEIALLFSNVSRFMVRPESMREGSQVRTKLQEMLTTIRQRVQILRFIGLLSQDKVTRAGDAIDSFASDLESVVALGGFDGSQRLRTEIDDFNRRADDIVRQLQALLHEASAIVATARTELSSATQSLARIAEAISTNHHEIAASARQIEQDGQTIVALGEEIKHDGKQVQTMTLRVVQTNSGIQLAAITFLVGLSAVGALLSWLAIRTTVAPIRRCVELMREIATGKANLSTRLAVSGDIETADLAANFNRFVENIGDIVHRIVDFSVVLAKEAGTILGVSGQTRCSAMEQHADIERITASIESMRQHVADVAGYAEQADDLATTASTSAEAGELVVDEVLTSINELSTVVNEAATKIESVGGATQEIESILCIIQEISEQTNLLALNAAIEAARAGDQGRGFAVVADEVRNLARRTQDETVNIQTMINSLQNGAQEAIGFMQEGRNQTQSTVERAQNAREALLKIAGSVNQIVNVNKRIYSSTTQQSNMAGALSADMQKVKNIAEATAQVAEQTSLSSSEFTMMAEQMKEMVKGFSDVDGSGANPSHTGADNAEIF